MRKEEIYKKVLLKWGVASQILMFFEEVSELSVELCHAERKDKNMQHAALVEELADVEIMLEQMASIFNVSRNDILKVKEMKLQRLEGLVGK